MRSNKSKVCVTLSSEAYIQGAILKVLAINGLVHWRQNLGGVIRFSKEKNGVYLTKNPMQGFPDICGLTPKGQFWFIEVKSPKGRVTPKQKHWHERLILSGAVGEVINSLEGACLFIAKLCKL